MKLPITILFFVLLCSTFTSFAQEEQSQNALDTLVENSVAPDSLSEKESVKKPFFKRNAKGRIKPFGNYFDGPYPVPRKALFLSLFVPGAGQVYNKKYWKLPVVYGTLGALGYAVYFNGGEYRRFKKAYIARVDGLENTIDEFTILQNGQYLEQLTAVAIKNNRDQYSKNLQLSYAGIILFQLLTGVDAFVDAHLFRFNVDEDLSLEIAPGIQQFQDFNQQAIPSFSIKLKQNIQFYPSIHPAFK